MQLPALYHQSDAESALRLSTQAISYASSTKSGHKAAKISRRKYVQAIRAVEKAIRNPVEVKKDETLYAVLLLCGYEVSPPGLSRAFGTKMMLTTSVKTIMGDSEQLLAWGTHVDGAAALVKIRGNEALSSPVSRSMFFFVRKNMILSHMQTSRPLDTVFIERNSITYLHENVEDQLISKTTRIPQLQHQANSLLIDPNCNSRGSLVEKLISAARILDRELLDWAGNVPISWKYSTATNLHPSPHSGFIPHHLHRYVDFYTARGVVRHQYQKSSGGGCASS
ncbi:uncharacterized protein BP5553_01591 [Venustampulla echinocandica]|uniref:Uncharacterized protein n=1 Tax=Venustampulla echinocandica TaxID=2656787 RepID=A0A370U1F5_9HELO|nr:uncharacterized protein BP5553_01591 [Venustampulla echinocandica]RDL41612.1 hypothetical protein BP5553_01591 [Venustampulla echinocandica]